MWLEVPSQESQTVLCILGRTGDRRCNHKGIFLPVDRVICLAVKFARAKEKITDTQMAELIEDLKKIPDQVEMLLGNQEKIQRFAKTIIWQQRMYSLSDVVSTM